MANSLSIGDEIPSNCELIEVHVAELRLLFNPIDPSPPQQKDLERRVEEFIVDRARSAKHDTRLALQVDVDNPGPAEEASTVGAAVRDFFRERSVSASRRLKQLFRVGRTSLLIGLAFLAVAVTVASILDRMLGGIPVGTLIRETLVIGGWVAMWRPLEIFLYDWWPIREERKLYDRMSVMPVRVTFREARTDIHGHS